MRAHGRTFVDERAGTKRLKIFERVKRGELRKTEAAALCGFNYRYTRPLYKRYCALGDRGLVHQGRGRQSNRAYASVQSRIVNALSGALFRFRAHSGSKSWRLMVMCSIAKNGVAGCAKLGCGSRAVTADGIAVGASAGRTSANECNWMVRITNCSKSADPSAV